MSKSVFICHNSKDKPQVERIADFLQQNGIDVWMDMKSLPLGVTWYEYLFNHIDDLSAALIFLGPYGLGPIQEQEIERLLRTWESQGKSIIPVLLPGFHTEKPTLPHYIHQQLYSKSNYLDLSLDYATQLTRLVRTLTDKSDLDPVDLKKTADSLPQLDEAKRDEVLFVTGWTALHLVGYVVITALVVAREALPISPLIALLFTIFILTVLVWLGRKQLTLRRIELDQAGGIAGASVAVLAVALVVWQAPGEDAYIRPIGALATAVATGLIAGWVGGWQMGSILGFVASAMAFVAAALVPALESVLKEEFGNILIVASAIGAILWSLCLAKILLFVMTKPKTIVDVFK